MATASAPLFTVPQRLPKAGPGYDRANEQETRRIIELALRQKEIGGASTIVISPDLLDTNFNLQRKNLYAHLKVLDGDYIAEGSFAMHTPADPVTKRTVEDEAGARALELSIFAPAWLRLYALLHDLVLDRHRGCNSTDYPATPCLLDVVTGDVPATQKIRLFDQGVEGVHILNRDDPAKNLIYYRLELDPASFADGIFVTGFPKLSGQDCFGNVFVLADEGTSADVFGWAFTHNVPAGFHCDGGWDAYWISWLAPGIRARGTPGIATLFPRGTSLTSKQTSAFSWSPLPVTLDAPSWALSHVYFAGDPLGHIEAGVVRSGSGVGHASITQYDAAGAATTLASSATDIDASVTHRLTTHVSGTKIQIYIDGALDIEADLPTVFLGATVFQSGIRMVSATVPSATLSYGGLAMYDYGIADTEGFFVPIILGYAPTEHPGGTIGAAYDYEATYEDTFEYEAYDG